MLRLFGASRGNIAARRRPRPGRRHLGALALAVLGGTLAPAIAPQPAAGAPRAASPIDDKRAEARRLEAAIAENGLRISMLDEDYNEARLRIDEAERGIADAETRMAAAEREARRIHSLVQGRAAELYMQAGSGSLFPEFDATDVREVGSRAKYTAAAAARDDELLDNLQVAGELLDARRAELETQRAAAEAEQAVLAERRADIEEAQAEQEALLAQVQGDIARLVREERERREREEAARARAEMEARLAAEQAAREAAAAATSTTVPAGDDDGSGGGEDGGGEPAPVPPPVVPAPNPSAQVAVDTALAQLGKPYRYAAAGPDAFDCSGLTMYAWAAAGVGLPHSSRAQFAALPHVPMDALAPGDLVFYGSPIHHVGMYIGGGQYVHAPQTGDVVKISSYYRSDFAGAARPG